MQKCFLFFRYYKISMPSSGKFLLKWGFWEELEDIVYLLIYLNTHFYYGFKMIFYSRYSSVVGTFIVHHAQHNLNIY